MWDSRSCQHWQMTGLPTKTPEVAFRAVEGQARNRNSLLHSIGILGCGSPPRILPGDFVLVAGSPSRGGRLIPSFSSTLWANGATPFAHFPRGPTLAAKNPRSQRPGPEGGPQPSP